MGEAPNLVIPRNKDSFPLGILDDAAYEETGMQLPTGKVTVLTTNGIVEATNEQEEMFGFDRLLEVIRNSQTKTAESLLEEIRDKFAGTAAQHDDITIIVIQATEWAEGMARRAWSKG